MAALWQLGDHIVSATVPPDAAPSLTTYYLLGFSPDGTTYRGAITPDLASIAGLVAAGDPYHGHMKFNGGYCYYVIFDNTSGGGSFLCRSAGEDDSFEVVVSITGGVAASAGYFGYDFDAAGNLYYWDINGADGDHTKFVKLSPDLTVADEWEIAYADPNNTGSGAAHTLAVTPDGSLIFFNQAESADQVGNPFFDCGVFDTVAGALLPPLDILPAAEAVLGVGFSGTMDGSWLLDSDENLCWFFRATAGVGWPTIIITDQSGMLIRSFAPPEGLADSQPMLGSAFASPNILNYQTAWQMIYTADYAAGTVTGTPFEPFHELGVPHDINGYTICGALRFPGLSRLETETAAELWFRGAF